MGRYRYLSQEQIQQIRELSTTHYIKEIAQIMGVCVRTVIREQVGLENVKRKRKSSRIKASKKPRRMVRVLTQEKAEEIKKLSTTHYASEIAKMLDLLPGSVINCQRRHGIENPKRKIMRGNQPRKVLSFETPDGMFDIDAWSKEFNY
jgi:hypothetical protein